MQPVCKAMIIVELEIGSSRATSHRRSLCPPCFPALSALSAPVRPVLRRPQASNSQKRLFATQVFGAEHPDPTSGAPPSSPPTFLADVSWTSKDKRKAVQDARSFVPPSGTMY